MNPIKRFSNLTWWHWLLFLLSIKCLMHLFLNAQWSFHRDELLYLALGQHLDWGYASVPAGIGGWAWFGDQVLGGSVAAIRLIATLFGTGTVLLTGLMAKEMLPERQYSGRFSMVLIGISGLTCSAFLRPCMLFMPVVFDIFYWTLLSWLLLKYINTRQPNWLIWLGIVTGLGLLNKYTVLIFLFAVLPGLLLTDLRKVFLEKKLYIGIGLALLLLSPNLMWQYKHGFPVFRHMSELAASQFANVTISGFLGDQLLFFLPVLPVWLYGLYVLLFKKYATPWRPMGWMYLMTLGVLLFFNAKSYYSLGAYPVLIAAGAAFLEMQTVDKRRWLRGLVCALALSLGILVFPVSLPLFEPEKEALFFKKMSRLASIRSALRWEDGDYHSLPQDFADMIGWEPLGDAVGEIWQSLPDRAHAAVYAENYGQAGAITQFGRTYGIQQVMSFSDNFQYWLPDSLPAGFQTLLYVNDELGDDMPGYFQKIEKVWELDMPLSRQHGVQIYRCDGPTPAFYERMNSAFRKSR